MTQVLECLLSPLTSHQIIDPSYFQGVVEMKDLNMMTVVISWENQRVLVSTLLAMIFKF